MNDNLVNENSDYTISTAIFNWIFQTVIPWKNMVKTFINLILFSQKKMLIFKKK